MAKTPKTTTILLTSPLISKPNCRFNLVPKLSPKIRARCMFMYVDQLNNTVVAVVVLYHSWHPPKCFCVLNHKWGGKSSTILFMLMIRKWKWMSVWILLVRAGGKFEGGKWGILLFTFIWSVTSLWPLFYPWRSVGWPVYHNFHKEREVTLPFCHKITCF